MNKVLTQILQNELSLQLLDSYIFTKEETWTKKKIYHFKKIPPKSEQIQLAIANKIVYDHTKKNTSEKSKTFLIRFFLDLQHNVLYLNYFNSFYSQWETSKLESTTNYVENFLIQPPKNIPNTHKTPIFLNRNAKKLKNKFQK